MPFVNKFKILVCTACLLGFGQSFGAWDGSSKERPDSTTIDGKMFYLIENEAQLAWFAEQTDTTTKDNANIRSNINAKLLKDMDLGGHLWIPIAAGKGDTKFKGTFDGDGHKISGLYTDGAQLANVKTNVYCTEHDKKPNCNGQNVGFIGTLSTGGVVKDLILEIVDIQASNGEGSILGKGKPISVGSLVGWQEAGTISGIFVTGSITTSGDGQGVGGIVGNAASGTIVNCVSEVSIYVSGNNAFVGGIAGYTKGKVNINSCAYTGTGIVNAGNGKSGGVVGQSTKDGLNVQNTYYDSDVVAGGIGMGKITTGQANGVPDVNSEDVVCGLNGGTWEDGVCKNASSSVWSVGQDIVSLNGSDGYTITFNANEGTFGEGAKTRKIVAKGALITEDEITKPTRKGYKFLGWATTSTAQNPSASLGTATASTMVYAVWTLAFTITFDADDGYFPSETQPFPTVKTKTVDPGDPITVEGIEPLPETYCTGTVNGENCDGGVWMYFRGWAFDKGASVEQAIDLNALNTFATKDTTLYAIWTAKETYTVTFHADGHGKTKVEFVEVDENDLVPEPNAETIEVDSGYLFAGWYLDGAASSFNFAETKIHSSIVLYAHWDLKTYTVTYNDGGSVSSDEYNIETGIVFPKNPIKEGHVFAGWYYDEGFTQRATQTIAGDYGDLTVYGQWEPLKLYIVYLSGHNASGTISAAIKEWGRDTTLKGAVAEFQIKGCSQDGWTGTDNGDIEYALGATYNKNVNDTLYPHWTCNTYHVDYELNGGTNNNKNITSYTGPVPFTLNKASYTGFTFAGWFKENTFENQVEEIRNIDADLTLYAKWQNKIVYKPGEVLSGSGAKDLTEYKTKDQLYTFRDAIDKYVRENYTLDGWSTTDNGDKRYGLGASYDENVDIILYPHWTANEFTITYNDADNATNSNPTTYTVEDEITLSDADSTGYAFEGWFDSEDNKVTVIPEGTTGNIVLTAKWNKVYPFLVGDYGAVKVYENSDGSTTAKINGNSTEAVDISSDVVVDHVEFIRTFTVGINSTIMLPFSIDTMKISGGSFKEFAYVDESIPKALFYDDVENGIIKANTPYIFIPSSDTLIFNLGKNETVTLNTNDIVVPASKQDVDGGKWQFRGVYSRQTWATGDRQVWGYVASGNPDPTKVGKFLRAGAGAYINPFRAYLYNTQAEAPAQAPAPSPFLAKATSSSMDIGFVERETGETTFIGKLNSTTGEIKVMNKWFDMNGRRLDAKPTTKGIYYFNGKRVMVR